MSLFAFRIVSLSIFLFGIAAHAQSESATSATLTGDAMTSESSHLKLREILNKNKKYEEDTNITDLKMKADAGSLSRYSLKVSASYYGPPIDDLSNKSQPNPDHTVGNHDTAMTGSTSVRRRLDSDTTIGFGTGLRATTPLHGIQKFDVNNPYVSYDMTKKMGLFQVRNSPGVSYVTVPEYTKVGEFMGVNWDSSVVYRPGMSRFSLGIDTSVAYYFFTRPYDRGNGSKGSGDGRSQRSNISLYPGLKYQISDTLNFSTSLNISFWNPRSEDSQLILWNKSTTQRLALGWAIKRDIFLQPYIDYYPLKPDFDTSTINFSTVFSIL